MNTRLARMIDNNRIPLAGGVWIDCYNQSVSDIAGTVLAGINSKNHYFVTDMERKVLGWTRDKRGKIVDRHAVDVANSVTAAKRDNTQNYVVEHDTIRIPQATKRGSIEVEIGGVCDLSYPNSKTRRGRVQDGGSVTPALTAHTENTLRRIEAVNTEDDGTSRTIKRQYQQSSRANFTRRDSFGSIGATDGIRIRKLTPRECFRLMGVKERDIDKIQAAGISKSQQYKLAGNSIVVNCLAAIFRQLFIGNFNKVV